MPLKLALSLIFMLACSPMAFGQGGYFQRRPLRGDFDPRPPRIKLVPPDEQEDARLRVDIRQLSDWDQYKENMLAAIASNWTQRIASDKVIVLLSLAKSGQVVKIEVVTLDPASSDTRATDSLVKAVQLTNFPSFPASCPSDKVMFEIDSEKLMRYPIR